MPLFPGFDTLGTLEHLRDDRARPLVVRAHAEDHREGVRALGQRAEPRPHRQETSEAAREARSARARPAPVEAFKQHGVDFVVADTLDELVTGMNALSPATPRSTSPSIEREIEARDRELDNDVHEGPADHRDARRPQLPRRQADPRGDAAPHPRPEGRPADRGEAAHPHPQDASAASRPTSTPRALGADGSRCPGSTPSARRPDSAAAACTATARSRAPSSADASSPAVRPGARSLGR